MLELCRTAQREGRRGMQRYAPCYMHARPKNMDCPDIGCLHGGHVASTTVGVSACLVDGHPCLIVVNTRQHHVHPGLALSITDATLESLKAIYCCDVHGVALKLDIRVDAAQRLSSSICFCQA